MADKQRYEAYAFRTFPAFGVWDGVSSAEWSESVALELGERVAEYEFDQLMTSMWPGGMLIGNEVVL